jgi:hypothetical protein
MRLSRNAEEAKEGASEQGAYGREGRIVYSFFFLEVTL